MTAPQPVRKPYLFWLVIGLGMLMFLLPLLAVAGVLRCLHLGSGAASLRDSALKSTNAAWEKRVELRVGVVSLSLARAGLSFLELPPEARAALGAVRGAEVGVYELRSGRPAPTRATMLASADEAMSRRGWDRMVGVVNRESLVMVYVPREMRSARDVRACVLVFDGRQMVVASIRSNLEPLLELALKRAPWDDNGRAQSEL